MEWFKAFVADVLAAGIGGGLLMGAAVYFLRERLTLAFDKLLEDHKSKLAKELESFRARVAGITGRRIDALMHVYQSLIPAHRALRDVLNPVQPTSVDNDGNVHPLDLERRTQEMIQYVNFFIDAASRNRPLLEDDIWGEIDTLITFMRRAIRLGVIFTSPGGDAHRQAWQLVENEITPALDRIDERAKRLLAEPSVES